MLTTTISKTRLYYALNLTTQFLFADVHMNIAIWDNSLCCRSEAWINNVTYVRFPRSVGLSKLQLSSLHQLVMWQTFRVDVRNKSAFIYKNCNGRRCLRLWLLARCAENAVLRRNFESVSAVTVLWTHLWPARRHSQWSARRI